MPLDIRGALPQQQNFGPKVTTEEGLYDAHFLGFGGQPYKNMDNRKPCGICKGTRQAPIGGTCLACDGSGQYTTIKNVLRYEVNVNGQLKIEEEAVTFRLSEGGVGRDGQPISPSTFYLRMRAISGLSRIEDIQEWCDRLPDRIYVPCRVLIQQNQKMTALKIGNVFSRNGQGPSGPSDGGHFPAMPQPSNGISPFPRSAPPQASQYGNQGDYRQDASNAHYASQAPQRAIDPQHGDRLRKLRARMEGHGWNAQYRSEFVSDQVGVHGTKLPDITPEQIGLVEEALLTWEQFEAARAAAGRPSPIQTADRDLCTDCSKPMSDDIHDSCIPF